MPLTLNYLKISSVKSKKVAIGRILNLAQAIGRKDITYEYLVAFPTKYALVSYYNTLIRSFNQRKENR